jgi:hypothetical protein
MAPGSPNQSTYAHVKSTTCLPHTSPHRIAAPAPQCQSHKLLLLRSFFYTSTSANFSSFLPSFSKNRRPSAIMQSCASCFGQTFDLPTKEVLYYSSVGKTLSLLTLISSLLILSNSTCNIPVFLTPPNRFGKIPPSQKRIGDNHAYQKVKMTHPRNRWE